MFDPLPEHDIPEGVQAAGEHRGVRGMRSDPGEEASRETDATGGADSMNRAPDGERAIGGSSGTQAPEVRTPTSRERTETLEIPATHEATPRPDAALPVSIGAESPLRPLLGHWAQVDVGERAADFGPGGFDLSLLAIRPTQRSMQLYRVWGSPPALVIAADLRATFDASGRVRVEESPTQPSNFPKSAIQIPPADGRVASTVLPPTRTLPCDTTWSIEPDGRLRLDGRLYRPIERAMFDRLKTTAARVGATAQTPSSSAAPDGASRPAEPAGGVDFFGASVRGRYVCFVCDISGSMQGDKLEALKTELTRTIRALPEGSQVQVTFFSDRPYVLVQGWTRTGTPACEALIRKIDGVGCGGGTDAVEALAFALAQLDPLPHELFLLTDGRFARDPSEAIAQLNGGADRTRIHTLGMGDDADLAALEAIARANGGTFTHVPAAAPRRPLR